MNIQRERGRGGKNSTFFKRKKKYASLTLSIPNLHVVIVDHVGKMVGGESV